jgi:hypothetical protein
MRRKRGIPTGHWGDAAVDEVLILRGTVKVIADRCVERGQRRPGVTSP